MSSADIDLDEVIYPSSDGQPMAETPEHLFLMIALICALRHHFKNSPDTYAIGNMFLYYKKGDPGAKRAPDVMVVKGVDPTAKRRSFKIWVEGAVPSVVFELTSQETADEDLEVKLPLYQELGVREYFLFDPLNEYLPRQFMGYRLVNQKYQELTPDDEDALISEELGLRLVPQGCDLLLFDIETGKRLLSPEESYDILDEMNRQAEDAVKELQQMEQAFLKEKRISQKQKQLAEREKQRAEKAKRHADDEKLRADQEKQRADALAAELARLRAQHNQPPS